MPEFIYFAAGLALGAVIMADCLGAELAKRGSPFWQGWMKARTFGLWR